MTPVVGGNVVYDSFPYGAGASAVQIEVDGDTLKTNGLWRTPGANQNYWTSPIYHEGHLYGTFGYYDLTQNTNGYTGRMSCLELLTGKVKWTQNKIVNGGIIMVGGHLVVLTQKGEIKLIKPDPAACLELGSVQAVGDWCWNSPVFSDGRLYVRSRIQAACLPVGRQAAGLKVPVGYDVVGWGQHQVHLCILDPGKDRGRQDPIAGLSDAGSIGNSIGGNVGRVRAIGIARRGIDSLG